MSQLEEKLLASSPYTSFRSERRISDALTGFDWRSTHGLYYQDHQTGKQRELDVIARQIWRRKLSSGDQLCRITLLLEVKSMAGFHLLLSDHPATSRDFHNHIHWFADPRGKYVDLSRQMADLHINPKDIDALVRKTHRFAYPGGSSRPRGLMVRPHPLTTFTSFRETNVGSEKDLDNSVFWRASQNLRSAHASIASDIHSTHLDTILTAAEYAPRNDWMNSTLWWTKHQIGIVDIIHPIVITDATLWATEGESLRSRGFARFGARTYTGHMDWWCDVVNSDHFDEYAKGLTDHYRNHLRRFKAKL